MGRNRSCEGGGRSRAAVTGKNRKGFLLRPRILITRPQEQAAGTCAFFEAAGFETHHFPVLHIQPLVTPAQIEAAFRERPYDGIILTSQQALSGLEEAVSLHAIPVYVPGNATAETAREKGFSNVLAARGTAESLAGILPDGVYLYLRAEEISVPLREISGTARIHELVAYRAEANPNAQALLRLLENRFGAVLFYSAKTASAFEEMTGSCADLIGSATAVALSGKVAASLKGPWKAIVQSATPDEKGMLKALESLNLSREPA